MVFAFTISFGRLFHGLQTLFVKKFWYRFLLLVFFIIVKLWPLNLDLDLKFRREFTEVIIQNLFRIVLTK